MNKIALAAGLSLLGTATSFAADMAVKAPVAPPPPPCIWCGAYVGLNAGYAWADPSVDSSGAVVTNTGPGGFLLAVAPAAATGLNASIPAHRDGFIGGGQIGYNWQAGNFVAGVEADIQWLSGRGAGTVATSVPLPTLPGNFINATLSATNSVDWLGTLRGRAGFTLAPAFLVYATGGLAYGEAKSSTAINQVLVGPATTGANAPYASVANFSETRVGWTAGAGVNGCSAVTGAPSSNISTTILAA